MIVDTESLVRETTEDYIAQHADEITIPALLSKTQAASICADLLNDMRARGDIVNATLPKGQKIQIPSRIDGTAAAMLVIATGEVRLVRIGESYRIAVRRYEQGQPVGVWEYVTPKMTCNSLTAMIRNVMRIGDASKVISDTISAIQDELASPAHGGKYISDVTFPNWLVPVRNGVFDCKAQTLTPWTAPDYESKYGQYCWMYTIDTPYVPHAVKPTYWDPDAFVDSLFDDNTKGEASRRVVWQAMAFMVRRWSGTEGSIFYGINDEGNADGHGGKSTLIELLISVIEPDKLRGWASNKHRRPAPTFRNGTKIVNTSPEDWSKSFGLSEKLMYALIIYINESDDGSFVRNTGTMKKLARAEILKLEDKYKDALDYAFPGFIAWMQNELPTYKTKDGATTTHAVYVGFNKNFSGADCDPDIKNSHIFGEEVAEYVLSKLLEMPYAEDYDPADLAILSENIDAVIENNVPSLSFLDEVLPQLGRGYEVPSDKDPYQTEYVYSDLMPAYSLKFLYALYVSWARKSGISPISRNSFKADLLRYARIHSDQFEMASGKACFATAFGTRGYEYGGVISPVIAEYGLDTIYCADKYDDMKRMLLDGKVYTRTQDSYWLIRR